VIALDRFSRLEPRLLERQKQFHVCHWVMATQVCKGQCQFGWPPVQGRDHGGEYCRTCSPELPRLLLGVMDREMGEKLSVRDVGKMGCIIADGVSGAFQVIM